MNSVPRPPFFSIVWLVRIAALTSLILAGCGQHQEGPPTHPVPVATVPTDASRDASSLWDYSGSDLEKIFNTQCDEIAQRDPEFKTVETKIGFYDDRPGRIYFYVENRIFLTAYYGKSGTNAIVVSDYSDEPASASKSLKIMVLWSILEELGSTSSNQNPLFNLIPREITFFEMDIKFEGFHYHRGTTGGRTVELSKTKDWEAKWENED